MSLARQVYNCRVKNIQENSVSSRYPELVQFWDSSLNDKTSDEVSYGARYMAHWVCGKGHKYSQLVLNKTLGGQGCPYCSGAKVLRGVSDLETTHPNIASEWSDKNKKSPDQFSRGSDFSAYWLGKDCGHTYMSRISRRVAGHGCGVCSGHQIILGVNDLLSKVPKIAAELDKELQSIDPSKIFYRSSKKVFWRCSVCARSWESAVSQRTVYGYGCTGCLEANNPKVVEIIARLLGSSSVNVRLDDVRWPTGQRVEVDILLGEVVVEYDGDRFHVGKEAKDIQKSKLLLEAGYRVVRLREPRCKLLEFKNLNFKQTMVRWSLDESYWRSVLKSVEI